MKQRIAGLILFLAAGLANLAVAANPVWTVHMQEAVSAQSARRFADAEIAFKQAIAALDPDAKGDAPRFAVTYTRLGRLYEWLHVPDQAEQSFRRALDWHAKSEGSAAEGMQELARFYRSQGRLVDAKGLDDRIDAYWSEIAGPDSVKMALLWRGRAEQYAAAKHFAEAEALYRGSVALLKKTAGPREPVVVLTASSLARLLAGQGDSPGALAVYSEATGNADQEFMTGTNIGREILREYAGLLRLQNRAADADELQARMSRRQPPIRIVGPDHTSAEPLYKPEPEYGPDASLARIGKSVLVSMEINELGAPDHIFVIQPLGAGLDERAIETVKTWRFRPATQDGQPVRSAANFQVSFKKQ